MSYVNVRGPSTKSMQSVVMLMLILGVQALMRQGTTTDLNWFLVVRVW